MKICEQHSHLNALDILLSKQGILDEIQAIIQSDDLTFGIHKPKHIKQTIDKKFNHFGWADRVKIQKNTNLTISYVKNKVGICFQIGNVARTYADLLKLAYMIDVGSIDVGVMIVPDKKESELLGANYASFDRLSREITTFTGVIHFPILVISLSNQEE